MIKQHLEPVTAPETPGRPNPSFPLVELPAFLFSDLLPLLTAEEFKIACWLAMRAWRTPTLGPVSASFIASWTGLRLRATTVALDALLRSSLIEYCHGRGYSFDVWADIVAVGKFFEARKRRAEEGWRN